MSHRLAKVNKHIQRTLGEIIHQEADLPPDVLVTISRVEVTANLKSARVWLYIFPLTKANESMSQLKKQMYHIQGVFNRQLAMRPLPRLLLQLDHGAEHADTINRALNQVNDEEDKRDS